jgi:hypothetical protein
MKNYTLIFVFILLLSNTSNVFAQASVCGNFHKEHCEGTKSKEDKRKFLYNSQSRSGLFSQGVVSKMKCVIYKGMDYRMTICCETAEAQVNFKIFDAKTKEELFDNAKNENAQQFEFQSTSTRSLLIEVAVPTGDATQEKGKPMDGACVGLLIEHKISEKSGFTKY